jgi:hypothetical protein
MNSNWVPDKQDIPLPKEENSRVGLIQEKEPHQKVD